MQEANSHKWHSWGFSCWLDTNPVGNKRAHLASGWQTCCTWFPAWWWSRCPLSGLSWAKNYLVFTLFTVDSSQHLGIERDRGNEGDTEVNWIIPHLPCLPHLLYSIWELLVKGQISLWYHYALRLPLSAATSRCVRVWSIIYICKAPLKGFTVTGISQ